MKKLILALFIIGLIVLVLHLLEFLAGMLLLIISVACLIIAGVLWIVHRLR